jgi:hypothetical protein
MLGTWELVGLLGRGKKFTTVWGMMYTAVETTQAGGIFANGWHLWPHEPC